MGRVKDIKDYDAIIVVTPKDYLRLESQYFRLVKWLPVRKLVFIGNEEVGRLVKKSGLGEDVSFVDENDLLPFQDVHRVMAKALHDVYKDELPRGITGWYYQQFLKMKYAELCQDEYYMVWDGDTIPCAPFSMFSKSTQMPYLDLKTEYHAEYFETLEVLFPGMKKCIQKSFIAEHMLMNVDVMKRLIQDIEQNDRISGTFFWEKIIWAVGKERLLNTGFSEFETYGTYIAYRYPAMYKLRDWHSFRYGGEFFELSQLSDEDLCWLSKDFFAISFEKNHFVREDHRNLFNNKEYQSKMSARKMLEIAQQEFGQGSYQELWEDSVKTFILEASACEERGDREGQFRAISQGLKQEYNNYELYYMLGFYYLSENMNKTYLCFQNALHFCNDAEDWDIINKDYQKIANAGVDVVRTAIVIVSYENLYLLQKNIESIRNYSVAGSYEIIVVDNGSSNEVAQWLQEQNDIRLILNEENVGFAKACNQGAEYANELFDGQCDIFLLNNDTRLAPNTLFWLRMGLYEDSLVGATGCVANYAGNKQQMNVQFTLPEEYLEFGKGCNVPLEQPYEERTRLSGFAMLVKKNLWQQVEGMDEAFTPGYFEDDDLSMKLQKLGYKLLVCKNSFLYHAGSQSFAKREDLEQLLIRNHQLFCTKYGFDILKYAYPKVEVLEHITYDKEDTFSVLELGCGLAANLKVIKLLYPQARVVGLEKNKQLYDISHKTNAVFCHLKIIAEAFLPKQFNILITPKDYCETLDEEEKEILQRICSENCVTIELTCLA